MKLREQTCQTATPLSRFWMGYPWQITVCFADRLIIDDPDDYAWEYTVADRIHGTAMSSLVVHGDLSDEGAPLSRPVYVRPITKPIDWFNSPRPEQIPRDVLMVDLIHRAVRRMYEGEGTDEASAPTVRIINFSIGDPSRLFTQVMSPLARLLDWLSVKHRVLIIISAGNHSSDIDTGISKANFAALSDDEKEAVVVKALYGDARHRKLLAPAESINGITVGALHHDPATVSHIDHAVNLFDNLFPSPISGIRKWVSKGDQAGHAFQRWPGTLHGAHRHID